jgi:twitching motility two-component system response regulator PilH
MRHALIALLIATSLVACGSFNATQATDADGATLETTGSTSKSSRIGGKIHVLVVDDSSTERAFLAKLLSNRGFVVSTAEDSGTTMQFLQDTAPDALPDMILMDVVMPGQNGFQLTRAISRDERYRQIPIIMVTSKNQETDKIWAMRQGASDYVVKPVNVDELIEKMRALIS